MTKIYQSSAILNERKDILQKEIDSFNKSHLHLIEKSISCSTNDSNTVIVIVYDYDYSNEEGN